MTGTTSRAVCASSVRMLALAGVVPSASRSCWISCSAVQGLMNHSHARNDAEDGAVPGSVPQSTAKSGRNPECHRPQHRAQLLRRAGRPFLASSAEQKLVCGLSKQKDGQCPSSLLRNQHAAGCGESSVAATAHADNSSNSQTRQQHDGNCRLRHWSHSQVAAVAAHAGAVRARQGERVGARGQRGG